MEQTTKNEIQELFDLATEIEEAGSYYREAAEIAASESPRQYERYKCMELYDDIFHKKSFPKLNKRFSEEELTFLRDHCFAEKYGKVDIEKVKYEAAVIDKESNMQYEDDKKAGRKMVTETDVQKAVEAAIALTLENVGEQEKADEFRNELFENMMSYGCSDEQQGKKGVGSQVMEEVLSESNSVEYSDDEPSLDD